MKTTKADNVDAAIEAAKVQGVKFDYPATIKGNENTVFFCLHTGFANVSETAFWLKDAKLLVSHSLPRKISLAEYRNFERIGNISNPTGSFNATTKMNPRY